MTTNSLQGRRGLVESALRALDDAIARSPDREQLKTRRAELAASLAALNSPAEVGWMRRRLADLEVEMARLNPATTDPQRMLDLVREHEQLVSDLGECGP